MRNFVSLVILGLASVVCDSQILLKPQDIPAVSKILDTFHGPNTLKCEVQHDEPELDFSFRWIVTYSADCSGSKLEPEEHLVGFLRLRPRDGQPVYFADPQVNVVVSFSLPEGNFAVVDPSLNSLNPRAIGVGEGDYSVDFVLGTTKGRMFRTQWKVKTKFHKNQQIAGLPPNSAEAFEPSKWNEKLTPNGPKLTILLDAAVLPQTPELLPEPPIVTVTGPILLDPKDSYWLSSLTALLTHIPHKSADVIAFSIDRENEFFRQRNFNEEGYRQLSEALSKNKVGKPEASVVSQSQTLPEFLVGLIKQDEAEKDTGRIVIFVGPTAWLSRVEMPKDLKADFQNASARLFYFQYYDPSVFGAENLEYKGGLLSDTEISLSREAMSSAPRYPKDGIWKSDKTPDSIALLIKALGGQIVRIYSPEDFQQALAELLARVKLASH